MLKNTLYKIFDLPAEEYSLELYNTILDQREKAEETIRKESGIQEHSENILNSIRNRVETTVISLIHTTRGRLRRTVRIITATAAVAALIFVLLIPSNGFRSGYLKIAAWTGNPRIIKSAEKVPLSAGRIIAEGYTMVTRSNERITLKKESNLVILSGKTEMCISKLRKKKRMIAELNLKTGTAVFSLKKQSYSVFLIRTRLGSVAVTGTVFSVDVQKSKLRVAVTRGSVLFKNDHSKTIRKLQANHGLEFNGVNVRVANLDSSADFRDLQQLIIKMRSDKKEIPQRFIRNQGRKALSKPIRKKSAGSKKIGKSGVKKNTPLKRPSVNPVSYTGRTVRIHLKSGSVVRGKVIHNDQSTIRVRTSYNTMNIGKDRITKIEAIKN